MDLKAAIKRGLKYIVYGVPVTKVYAKVQVSSPTKKLRNELVLITGGSSGIGFAIAKKCVSEGARVIITGRNQEKLNHAKEALGDNCTGIVFDNSNVVGLDSFFSKIESVYPDDKIGMMICNAGVSFHESSFRKVTESGWDAQMDVNLKGTYFLLTKYIDYLENNKIQGNIVVISSERGNRADSIPYGLTKAALNSMIKGISKSVIQERIRINGVAPGVTTSEMTGYKNNGDLFASWQPQQRIFLAEEISEVVLFLLSSLSNCISGEVITCDQGRYISTWGED